MDESGRTLGPASCCSFFPNSNSHAKKPFHTSMCSTLPGSTLGLLFLIHATLTSY